MASLQTKINRAEKAILDLQNHLRSLKAQAAGHATPPDANSIPSGSIVITFDGGTSCNNPRVGFGKGYGSYQIGLDGPIRRVEFGLGHSCNSAEIRTLHAAIADLVNSTAPDKLKDVSLCLRGDSKIALKWANPKLTQQPAQGTWKEFHVAISMLREHIYKFASIKRIWHPREVSVKLFGH